MAEERSIVDRALAGERIPTPFGFPDQFNVDKYSMPRGKEVDAGNGWTRIGAGKGKAPAYIHGLEPLDRSLTLDKLRDEYGARARTWANSSCRRELKLLLDRKQPEGGWQLEKAVCLASGSFSRDNLECRRRSILQFAAVMDLIVHLQASSKAKIQIFAQDPKFTDLDREFLSSLDVTVLWDSLSMSATPLLEARPHLGPQTVIFELFMDLGAESIEVLLGSDVKLFIGSDVEWRNVEGETEEEIRANIKKSTSFYNHSWTDEHWNLRMREIKAIRKFQSRYSMYWLPLFVEDPNTFEGLAVFWEEESEEEGDGKD